MTEEEYFRKNYPDSCYGDKPLSPYWDFFQDGVEFGERQSEKKIEKLENKLERTEEDLADYQFNYPTIKELTEGTCFAHLKSLEKENAELKEKLKPENCLKLLAKGGYVKFTNEQLTKAKEIIEDIIRVTWGEGWNYSLDWKVKAEQFLKDIEK